MNGPAADKAVDDVVDDEQQNQEAPASEDATSAADHDVAAGSDSTEVATGEKGSSRRQTAESADGGKLRRGLGVLTGVQLSLGRLLVALLIVVMAVVIGVLGYQVSSKSDTIEAMQVSTENTEHAQKIAMDYAAGAANMDYKDLASWNKRLTQNTSPELASKLTEASSSMEQVITPLQWTSTSQPIAAQVKSHMGSTYVVNAFVSVTTKNAQAPDGVQSTATYTITLDSAKNWLITDVGGIDTAVGQK